MAILDILATVYLFCLANFLALEALDSLVDGESSPDRAGLDRPQHATCEVVT